MSEKFMRNGAEIKPDSQGKYALSQVIDSIDQIEFIPYLLDYIRARMKDYTRARASFVGMLLLVLDEKNRPFHIYDTIRDAYRINLDFYLDGVYELDPLLVKFKTNRQTCAMLMRDVAPDRFQLTEYYRRYYKNIELLDEMAIFIDLQDGRFLFFSIGRRTGEPKFSRRELKSIEQELPIIASLCRQHFKRGPYNNVSLTSDLAEQRLQFALERFGEEILTPRERDIAVCILKGHSSKSAAREIDISPETVKIHRKNIYRKLDVSSQSELFVRFLNTLG